MRHWRAHAGHRLTSVGLLAVWLAGTAVGAWGAEFSCQDFRFEVPAGWASVKPDREKTSAQLVLVGKSAGSPDGMLKVDVGKPVMPTAMDTARALAGKDGTVEDAPASIDGADGIRVRIPNSGMERPSHVLVVYRGGRLFLIMCAGAKGVDTASAFDQVIRTWRWSPQPAKPTKLGDGTVECSGHIVKYQLPADAVPIPGTGPDLVGAWKLESAGLSFIFCASPLRNGMRLIEADFVSGFEQTLGAKVGQLRDYKAGELTYREAYVDLPARPGAKAYTAHYWREGICIKVQGVCAGKDTNEGLRLLRQFLGSISITSPSGGPPPAPGAGRPAVDPWSSHELSKKFGGYGLLLLIAAGIIALVTRRKKKPDAGPGEAP
jgi:hypothetical protein